MASLHTSPNHISKIHGGPDESSNDESGRLHQELSGILALLRPRTLAPRLPAFAFHRQQRGTRLFVLDSRHGQSMADPARPCHRLRLRVDRPFLYRTQQTCDVQISALVFPGRLADVGVDADRPDGGRGRTRIWHRLTFILLCLRSFVAPFRAWRYTERCRPATKIAKLFYPFFTPRRINLLPVRHFHAFFSLRAARHTSCYGYGRSHSILIVEKYKTQNMRQQRHRAA